VNTLRAQCGRSLLFDFLYDELEACCCRSIRRVGAEASSAAVPTVVG
jgi:hypothetical protein